MTFAKSIIVGSALIICLSGCGRLKEVGKAPEFNSPQQGNEHFAMIRTPLPETLPEQTPTQQASLWKSGRDSLLGNQRAGRVGDILTVVIEINDKAEISNSTSRTRSGSESLSIPDLVGIPQRVNEILPEGASLDNAVNTNSSSSSNGDGSVRRNEKLTLRIAATIVDILPNGVLAVQGSQEVRVNFELRELLVNGYVRPADITRQNEITYDKIAAARISYGGRGQITDVQQPRYGQQVADIILPF
ncbi:flagellar basal body L-ring protein FlgH [uncultured Litoreibacter sp.]|uniref:flagellar basal body L-ring protein FlgH n=1 Tax=uncultured Litoreibacter sp. TaxID=1392394 RepID=UPI0026292AEF|nr:flagellar basal body L-ring protein FlgH [uncultured Litoreibacter sp.]